MLFVAKTIERVNSKLKWKYKDIKCGVHSNIPFCCIAWFVTVWDFASIDNKETYNLIIFNKFKEYGKPGYILCPKCIISGKRNNIKKCTCFLMLTKFGHWVNAHWKDLIKEI